MKSSNSYIFFPDNKALDRAVAQLGKQPSSQPDGEVIGASLAVGQATELDPLKKNTLGNFEQRGYDVKLLGRARTQLEQSLTDEFRQRAPLKWAATQDHLGTVLATLGQCHGDTGLLEKAVQAFNCALEERHQEQSPQEWASTQKNLGMALQGLGRMGQDAKRFKQSVNAFSNALTESTRQQAPQEWALTMHQLGTTFHLYGKLLKGNRTLQKSVVAYNNALTEFDADRDPLEHAISHGNLGAVLQRLAESEENAERVAEALRSYETALTVMHEQQLPIHLAIMTRINIAGTRNVLAEMTKDTAVAQEAIDELELILAVFGDACHPDCLKQAEEQLCKAEELVKAQA